MEVYPVLDVSYREVRNYKKIPSKFTWLKTESLPLLTTLCCCWDCFFFVDVSVNLQKGCISRSGRKSPAKPFLKKKFELRFQLYLDADFSNAWGRGNFFLFSRGEGWTWNFQTRQFSFNHDPSLVSRLKLPKIGFYQNIRFPDYLAQKARPPAWVLRSLVFLICTFNFKHINT